MNAYLSNKPHSTLLKDETHQIDYNKVFFNGNPAELKVASAALAVKITNTYNQCIANIWPDSDFIWIVEDDVEVPLNCLNKMLKHFDNSIIGTVSGRMLDRRAHECGLDRTVVTDYKVSGLFGTKDNLHVSAFQTYTNCDVPIIGTQIVGSTHQGCWLTRSNLVRELQMKVKEDGCMCCDNNWGWRLWKHKKMRIMMDWSIHCKHHYLNAAGQPCQA